jgi:hypothetical protein
MYIQATFFHNPKLKVLPDQVSSLKLVQVGFDGPARDVRSMRSAMKEPWLMLMLMLVLVGSKLQLTPVC